MTWVIDLNDSDFTVLSGLLDKDVNSSFNLFKKQTEAEVESWSSMNDQKCIMTECTDKCSNSMTWVNSADLNCEGSDIKKICCSDTAAFSSCKWQSDESDSSDRAYHEQCHFSELTLFFNENDDRHCVTEMQVFCCTTDMYADLISSCELNECSEDCSELSEKSKVAEQYEYWACEYRTEFYKSWCCTDNDLKNCHWVSKSDCDQNNCDELMILTVMKSWYLASAD